VLVAVFLVARAWRLRQRKTYSDECLQLPLSSLVAEDIDKILIVRGSDEVTLQRKEHTWYLGEEVADQERVGRFFSALSSSKCAGLASANKEHQDKFSLDEDARVRVSFFKQGNTELSFDLGKSGLQPGTVYVRASDSDMVYQLSSTNIKEIATPFSEDWIKKD